MYSSTLSLTTVLDGGGWSMTRRGCFIPGKTQYPLYRRIGGSQRRFVRVRKISPPLELEPRTVQPIASSSTD
jgi:hypothetical protein